MSVIGRIALPSIFAVVVGLAIILAPTLLFPSTVEYGFEYVGPSLTPMATPITTQQLAERSPTPVKEGSQPSLPAKLFVAYTIDIAFPSEEGSITSRRGDTVTIPLSIRSWVDEPIKIRLALVSRSNEPLPEFIAYEVERPITVNPRETVHSQITIKISENAVPGEYLIAITGQSQEPIEGYSDIALGFSLVVS